MRRSDGNCFERMQSCKMQKKMPSQKHHRRSFKNTPKPYVRSPVNARQQRTHNLINANHVQSKSKWKYAFQLLFHSVVRSLFFQVEFDLSKDSYFIPLVLCHALVSSLVHPVVIIIIRYVCACVCVRATECSYLNWRIHMEISCKCALKLWWASFSTAKWEFKSCRFSL